MPVKQERYLCKRFSTSQFLKWQKHKNTDLLISLNTNKFVGTTVTVWTLKQRMHFCTVDRTDCRVSNKREKRSLTLRTDTRHTQGSSTPVPELALILHMKENLFFQWTQLAWTDSLWRYNTNLHKATEALKSERFSMCQIEKNKRWQPEFNEMMNRRYN